MIEMNTVKLQWIQTQKNDPFTRDTYAIADSNFKITDFSFANDPEDYILPEGYTTGETVSGEVAVFDNKNNYCVLDRHINHPRLSSSVGVVYLKKLSRPL